MNTLNALVFTASVLSSATAHANLVSESKTSSNASPELMLSGENFIEGSMQDAMELFSYSTASTSDLSTLERASIAGPDYAALSSEAKPETNSVGSTFTALNVPNTFGMLLAGAGMIGFMVATRRKY